MDSNPYIPESFEEMSPIELVVFKMALQTIEPKFGTKQEREWILALQAISAKIQQEVLPENMIQNTKNSYQ